MENIDDKPELKTIATSLVDNLTEYVQTYFKLGKINATQKATVVATTAISVAVLTFFSFFILFFAGIGIAIWVGEAWDNMKAGYFTVAGFYVLSALLFVALRKKMIFPYVRNLIIRKVYE